MGADRRTDRKATKGTEAKTEKKSREGMEKGCR